MRILVTGGGSALAQAVASRLLSAGHTVRLTDRPDVRLQPHLEGVECVECALDAGGATDDLCKGVDQVVHVEPALGLSGPAGGVGLLDACTRCTYNLFNSVAASGVRRVILLSSMAIFEAYAADIGVRPNFEPRPTSDLAQLAPHLAEFGAREFAVAGATRVIAARLGTLVEHAPKSTAPQPHRWWVSIEDASGIVCSLVEQGLPSGFSPVYTYWDAVNIGRGDGRDVDIEGNNVDNWWRRANGGNLEWRPPATHQQARPAVDAIDKVLLLGGSGMLGPDIVRALSGDLPYPVSENLIPTGRVRPTACI